MPLSYNFILLIHDFFSGKSTSVGYLRSHGYFFLEFPNDKVCGLEDYKYIFPLPFCGRKRKEVLVVFSVKKNKIIYVFHHI